MQIISISGLDGSGKSTQIAMLQKHLENQGKKVVYFHAISFSIAQKIKEYKKGLTDSQESSGNNQEKSVTSASWLQIQLRKIALYIDLMRFNRFFIKLSKEGYDYLLSDRYFYDSLINIAYLAKLERVTFSPDIKKPDYAFYLKTNPEIIMLRDRVPDQGINYLHSKKALLDIFSKENALIMIDGNRDVQSIHEDIKNKLS